MKVLMLKMARKGPVFQKTFTAKQIHGFANMADCRARQLDLLLKQIGVPQLKPNAMLQPQADEPQEHPQPHNDPPSDQEPTDPLQS